jgi:hypothetical protein
MSIQKREVSIVATFPVQNYCGSNSTVVRQTVETLLKNKFLLTIQVLLYHLIFH